MSLKGRTAFIAGATRGIGKAIAFKLAENGANVIIAGKTQSPHRFLSGTIFSIANQINKLHGQGRALATILDVRKQMTVKNAFCATVNTYGSLDILVNNFSAVKLRKLSDLSSSEINLMFDTNVIGPYNCIKEAMGHLTASKFGGHVVNLSPPIDMSQDWFSHHSIYSLSKLGQSMSTFGLSDVLGDRGIAINSLWSKNVIATGTSEYIFGTNLSDYTCSTDLMADALVKIVSKNSTEFTGKFLFAEDLVSGENVSDLENYRLKKNSETPLIPNLFHGNGAEVVKKRIEFQQKNMVNNIFKGINQSFTPHQAESVGSSFTIHLEDLNSFWTIDCKSEKPAFYRIQNNLSFDDSHCRLIMTTDTLREIVNKTLTPETVAISRKIRVIGNNFTCIRAREFLFNI